jgi:hypothetical protein
VQRTYLHHPISGFVESVDLLHEGVEVGEFLEGGVQGGAFFDGHLREEGGGKEGETGCLAVEGEYL